MNVNEAERTTIDWISELLVNFISLLFAVIGLIIGEYIYTRFFELSAKSHRSKKASIEKTSSNHARRTRTTREKLKAFAEFLIKRNK